MKKLILIILFVVVANLLYAQRAITLNSGGFITEMTFGSDTLKIIENGQTWKARIKDSTNVNYTVQTLTGTTPTWNMVLGTNAKITLTNTTTITISNLVAGRSGELTVTNAATAYTITFAGGYDVRIAQAVWSTGDAVLTSGTSKIDSYWWYYDGTYVIINGMLNYQ